MSRLIAFFLYAGLFVLCVALGVSAVAGYLAANRGVEPPFSADVVLGTNTALENYTDPAQMSRALSLVRAAHLTAIRQHFRWREIERDRGVLDWTKADEIVRQADAAGLRLIAVLDTAPPWAQRDYERDLPNAPPDNFDDYAAFVSAFAARYGSRIHDYQIWDEPNVHPNWGRRNAEPAEYGRLLHVAASAIRARDPQARVILAGLGMNLETQRPHPDYSEILFLRGLYENGFQKDFDIVAAKPYGMWSGPEDRRVSSSILNFSRVILLRDEMRSHGDAVKPMWAVEMGWNSLPANWDGPPSPWGSDAEDLQADRLVRGLQRARNEWGWMTGLFPLTLDPDGGANDPRRGFALVAADLTPRAAYPALASYAAGPPPRAPLPSLPLVSLVLLGAVAVVAGWRGTRYVPAESIAQAWRALERRFIALPEPAQFAILLGAAAAFYFSPSASLTLALLALLVPLFALRRDLGLVLLVFSIPFYLYPKTISGGFDLSAVEVFTLAGAAAWAWCVLVDWMGGTRPARTRLVSLDWAVLLFVALGLVSTRIAANFGVAFREWRVIVIEPALLYGLIRTLPLDRVRIERLVGALLFAGALACAVGLYQFAASDLIRADEVGRVRAVWGSPNNAGLFLGRLLPLSLALAVFLPARDRRVKLLYGALALLYGVVIYLTYSRGALFFGVPAGLAVILAIWAWQNRRRIRIPLWLPVAAVIVAALVVIPLSGTARFQSLFQTGTGTGFFRVSVWISALHMIRDHPLFGVGLDNFLYEYPRYMLPDAWREPNLSHPHNVLLDFWVRLGVLGAVVLVWMQLDFFRRVLRAIRDARSPYVQALAAGLAASMADFLAHGMIDAAYFVVDLAFVFMLTLALAVSIADRAELVVAKE